MNSTVANCSRPGASNMEILHRILNKRYTQDDYCVIMWTFPERDMLFNSSYLPEKMYGNTEPHSMYNTNHNDITYVVNSKMHDGDIQKDWVMVHNRVDCIIRSWYYVHYAFLHLNSLGVKQYHYFVDYYDTKYKPPFVNITPTNMDMSGDRRPDDALDGLHAGPKTHIMVAEKIKEDIR
jgi:hypothetical protein